MRVRSVFSGCFQRAVCIGDGPEYKAVSATVTTDVAQDSQVQLLALLVAQRLATDIIIDFSPLISLKC